MPRVITGKGMDYWESGMHLATRHGPLRFVRALPGPADRGVPAIVQRVRLRLRRSRMPVEEVQSELRKHIAEYLSHSNSKPHPDSAENAVSTRKE